MKLIRDSHCFFFYFGQIDFNKRGGESQKAAQNDKHYSHNLSCEFIRETIMPTMKLRASKEKFKKFPRLSQFNGLIVER